MLNFFSYLLYLNQLCLSYTSKTSPHFFPSFLLPLTMVMSHFQLICKALLPGLSIYTQPHPSPIPQIASKWFPETYYYCISLLLFKALPGFSYSKQTLVLTQPCVIQHDLAPGCCPVLFFSLQSGPSLTWPL